MFFEYPLQAFNNTYQSLKKNGAITFVSWGSFRYNQFFTIPAYSVKKITKIKIPKFNRDPGPFSLREKSYIQKLLKQSGFSNITIKCLKTRLKAGKIKTDVDILMNIGVGARMIRENKINKNTCKIIREDINMNLNEFSGNGSTTAFTLGQTPGNEDNLIVFVDGVYQNKDAFSISGTTLTFGTAPANGRKIIAYSI